MSIVIKKVLRGCLLPMMATEVLDQHVCDWAEVLFNEVPESELLPTYEAAVRSPTRDARFPLKVTEMLDAYRQRAGTAPRAPTTCSFCKGHLYDPTQFPECPFHPSLKTINERMLTL